MKCLFLLSGENPEIASSEAQMFVRDASLDGRLLIAECNREISELNGLAYTKKIYRLLFSCSKNKLKEMMENFGWNRVYKESFSLRIFGMDKKKDHSEKELASIIWNSAKKPRVDLENAKTKIGIFISKKAYCCILIGEPKNNFDKRKPQFRPGFAPVSLSPKLARAMVNLSGAKKEAITDPFCGTGGILVEAGLTGNRAVGYDIDSRMLEKCRKNLEFYKIQNYRLTRKNALEIKKRCRYIVTDLPYGQSSIMEGKNLYRDFIRNLKRILGKRAVIGLPHGAEYKRIFSSEGLKVIKSFSYYIHKSLTKEIFVVEHAGKRAARGILEKNRHS